MTRLFQLPLFVKLSDGREIAEISPGLVASKINNYKFLARLLSTTHF